MPGIIKSLQKLLFKSLKKIPAVNRKIAGEYDKVLKELEPSVRPYDGRFVTYAKIPEIGRAREEIYQEMNNMASLEQFRWQDGYVSGAVYHGDSEHIAFMDKICAMHSQCNPLHADLWPSTVKFEAEVVAMTAGMLSGEDPVCGSMTSGGTESILLAMKSYRDRALEKSNITKPEIVAPVTAHAAFDKAAQYFNIKLVKIPVDNNFQVDVKKAKHAVNKNTIAMVGSAPAFPHGIIDPIAELSQFALDKNIGFHTDACLGGFVLPWARKIGYEIPDFDFALPGVTSISVDTHKYGYAPKGSSVILYRNPDLRRYQFFTTADWPGGLYFSPTFAGSRPGSLIAACWAAMTTIGEQGYRVSVNAILKTAEKIKQGIAQIPELKILGNPLWVIAFASDELNIYQIMDFMSERRWNLNGLHHPACVHLCTTLRHTQFGVADRFLHDLKDAVVFVKKNPDVKGGIAPVYGMAAKVPDPAIVEGLLGHYIDLLYKVKKEE